MDRYLSSWNCDSSNRWELCCVQSLTQTFKWVSTVKSHCLLILCLLSRLLISL